MEQFRKATTIIGYQKMNVQFDYKHTNLASDGRVEWTSRDDSLPHPVGPGAAGEASVASEAAGVAARDQVLGREVEMNSGIAVNANAIAHRLDSSERPAAAATALISDFSQSRAVGPLFASIEILRQIIGSLGVVKQFRQAEMSAVRMNA